MHPLGSVGGRMLATAIMDDPLSRRQYACCSDRRPDARSAPINFSFLSFRSPIWTYN